MTRLWRGHPERKSKDNMFRIKQEHKKRSTNIVFGMFRLLLSLVMFAILVGGIYSAYKYFSGYDPIKTDPRAMVKSFISSEKVLDIAFSLLSLDILKKQSIIPAVVSKDEPKTAREVSFKFVLVSDTHSQNELLKKVFLQSQSKSASDIEFVIGLGDYTEVGTIDELNKTKNQFDATGVRYFVVPGDHDLWDSRDKQQNPLANFTKVFGPSYQSFDHLGVKFILLYNSDNYRGLGDEQMKWLTNELIKVKDSNVKSTLVFLHEPLYHPSSEHTMGWVTGDLKIQAKNVIKMLKEAGVNEVFAGDIHFFTRYTEPTSGLAMTTIGAVTDARNVQLPRYAIVTVYSDGSLDVEDVEIK